MTTESEFIELIPNLPEDVAFKCLTRLHPTTHLVASHVCQRWRRIIRSRDYYYHRKGSGVTQKAVCFVQSLPPVKPEFSFGSDSYAKKQTTYKLSLFYPESSVWEQINPIPKFQDGLPLFCQVASTQGKLVLMGGWDPVSWEPLRDVFMYDLTTRRWTQCTDMPSNRLVFAVGAHNGQLFIAGGHDEGKTALKTAWVYDLRKDEWSELAQMSEERDECEGVQVGSELWVVSGYETVSQGRFKTCADVLDMKTGEWRHVEEVWRVRICPRGRAGVCQKGEVVCWDEGESGSNVRVGACGVDLGNRIIVTGSEYQGGPQGFYLWEMREGQRCKLVKIDVPGEFKGSMQSGCCVEM